MNPFKYGCVVSGEFLCPRPELERQLKSYIQSGQNIVVHGERRMGKTSLVRHVVSSMRGIRMLYIDLYCIRTLSDFCRRVLTGPAATNENMLFLKKAMALMHRLRPSISFDPANGSPSISIDARAAEEPESLEAVMGMIRNLASSEKFCIVFDEFQDILDLENANVILAEMRSTIQFQQDTPYVFMGSVRNDMLGIFENDDSPFFKSAIPFTVGSIDEDIFADFIIKRFRKGDRIIDKTTAKTLISHADSVTGDVQELCEAIWETTDDDATISADDIPTSLELIFSREGEAYGAAIRSLTATQVSLLRALAATKLPRVFSEAFKESARITNTATIQKSLKRLAMKRLIYEYGDQYRFTNPFFREWLLLKM